jgi:hypothetical protein
VANVRDCIEPVADSTMRMMRQAAGNRLQVEALQESLEKSGVMVNVKLAISYRELAIIPFLFIC